MLKKGIDTLVLVCTHYPFIIPRIQATVGPDVRVIDPSPAIAAQPARVLDARGLRNPEGNRQEARFMTTGSPERMREQLRRLLRLEAGVDALTLP